MRWWASSRKRPQPLARVPAGEQKLCQNDSG